MKKLLKTTSDSWRLNHNDVTCTGSGSSSHVHGKRFVKINLTLTHIPTGLEVSLTANSSKSDGPAKARRELYAKGLAELERKVARHLRIPRR